MMRARLAAALILAAAAPAYGQTGGEQVNAGRTWAWTRLTDRSPEPRIQQITIHVRGQLGSGANLVIFRKAQS